MRLDFRFWVCLLCMPFMATAQKFEDDIVFDVKGYDIRQTGYPSKINGDGNGNILYYEFWQPGGGRKFTGYYVQSLNTDYAEEWFRPAFSQPELRFEPDQLFALDKSVVLTGYQYSPKEKKWNGHAHFYDKAGNEKSFISTDPAALKKMEAGFTDRYAVSPDKKRLVRLHANVSQGSKSPLYVSSLLSEGKLEWASQLKLPFTDEKYAPVKMLADNSGRVWFLMMYEGLSGKFETDKNFQPRVVVYNFRENNFISWKVNVAEQSIPNANFEMRPDGSVILCMASGDNLAKGFNSGARSGKIFNWNQVHYYQLKIEKEITVVNSSSVEIPAEVAEHFKQEGADFTGTGKLIQEGTHCVWLMESRYTQQKEQGKLDFYADVLIMPVNTADMKPGKIQFAEKKQRDLTGSVMCSYTTVTSPGKIHLVYLSSIGADGRIFAESLNLEDMSLTRTEMLSNEDGSSYFYPEKSGQISQGSLILMGMGDTNKQEYRLMRFSFK